MTYRLASLILRFAGSFLKEGYGEEAEATPDLF